MRRFGGGVQVDGPRVAATTVLSILVCVVFNGSCIFADCVWDLRLRGVVVASETQQPPLGVMLGSRTFTDGAETFFVPPDASLSPDDGSFELDLAYRLYPCYGAPPPFPSPDRIELIVVGPGCEQSIYIDINEQTVVDISFPNDVIELREPVLVPACPAVVPP